MSRGPQVGRVKRTLQADVRGMAEGLGLSCGRQWLLLCNTGSVCKLQRVRDLQALTVLKARVPLMGRRGPHFPGEQHAPYFAAVNSHGHSCTPQSSSGRRG